tara:strand:- start:72 stop:254 length:183 start_codon:yes stop_codon:yes gene_type:complete
MACTIRVKEQPGITEGRLDCYDYLPNYLPSFQSFKCLLKLSSHFVDLRGQRLYRPLFYAL